MEQTQNTYQSTVTLRGIIMTTAAVASLLYTLLAPASVLASASIKNSVSVSDDMIRLGDLFDGVDTKADTVLGASPKPGAEMVLNARTLMRIASAYNVEWKPSSAAEQVTIRRTAHIITTDDLRSTLHDAIAEKGIHGKFQVLMNNADAQIMMGGNHTPTVEVLSLNVVPSRNVFEAVMVAPSKANPVHKLSVSGMIQQMVDVPVVRAAMKTGDIIGSSDIDWIEIPEKTITGDVVLDADSLIGKTPARMLLASKQIRLRDVTSPQLVDRGEEITIQYKDGPVQLTIKGKALQNGAMGDVIRVLNVASNRSVMAQVTDDKVVLVQ